MVSLKLLSLGVSSELLVDCVKSLDIWALPKRFQFNEAGYYAGYILLNSI